MNINYIKQSLNYAVKKAAEKAGMGQPSHNRKLSWAGVIHLLIGAEGGSLAKELHRTDIDVTPAAVSQCRTQIDPETFQDVFQRFNTSCKDSGNFRGYRLLAVDGMSANIPRNLGAPSFVQNESAPNGYNQLHLNPLYDLCRKTFYDALIQLEPQKDKIDALIEMLKRNHFSEKSIIIADCGYESYNVMAHLLEKPNMDFLIRIKQNHSAMREVARLPIFELDCEIGFTITTPQTNEGKQKRYIFLQVPKKSKPGAKTRRGRLDFLSPYQMKLRIVRFQLETGEFETIATSLTRTFTLEYTRELYHLRWGIETRFRDLKYTLGLVNLHGKRDAFAEQEIWAMLTMFNSTSRIVREVVVKQLTEGVHAYRVNFKMAVALCREYFRTNSADNEKLLQEIGRYTVPVREGRRDKRKLKAKGFVGFTYRVAA